MKQLYNDFKKMFNHVSMDIVDDETVAVAFSGGVDSTAVALGLREAGKNIYLVHMVDRDKNIPQHTFQNYLCMEFSLKTKIPLFFVYKNYKDRIASVFKSYNINCFVSGDGLDRCYGYLVFQGERAGEREATFGEDFHCLHPLLDKFGKTIPMRYKYYKSGYQDVDITHKNELAEMKKLGMDIRKYSLHPELRQFFKVYEHNVRDIVYPKLLTYMYVKEYLGMDYFKFCRMVWKNHRRCFESFFERFLSHVDTKSLSFDINKLEKEGLVESQHDK